MIHTIPTPLIPGIWRESWRDGGGVAPDRWTATKRLLSGVIVHEVEFSNASFKPGQKARPTFGSVCAVNPPKGYTLVEDCNRALPTAWYPMRAAMRRYAIYPSAKPELRAEAEREARMPYAAIRWRRGRTAYGPVGMPMPALSGPQLGQAAFKVSGWLNHLRTILESPTGITGACENGEPPGLPGNNEDGIFVRRDGWNPWGIPDRGAPAGSGIFFYTGWEQAPDSPAYSWLKACCAHERAWNAYSRTTGRPISVYDYPDPGPMYQAGTWDPNNGLLPEFRGALQGPDPLPLPYDASHSVRGFRDLIFLSEATDSPGVARMLRSVAAQLRLQYSDRGPKPTTNYTAPCLRTWRDWMKANPHQGFFGMDTGRMIGWPATVIAQSIKRAGANENVPWASMLAEFAGLAAMPTGIISRCAHPDPNNVWFDPQHDTAHAFEVPIFWNGAIGCSIQSGRPIPNATRFAEALYVEAQRMPYYSTFGPPQYAYVAKRGGAPYAKIPGGKANTGDTSHSLHGCALAAHMNPSERAVWISVARGLESFTDYRGSAGIVAQGQI